MKLPPQMVMLADLHREWRDDEAFLNTHEMVRRLIDGNPDYWGMASAYGRDLTVQRLGRTLAQLKIRAGKNSRDQRGYHRSSFLTPWRQSGIAPINEPSEPSRTVEPSTPDPLTCRVCRESMPAMDAAFGTHASCDDTTEQEAQR